MGLLDSLVGAAANAALGGNNGKTGSAPGGLDAAALIGLATTLINQAGGLSGLLAKLQQGGLADVVQSWIGHGANQPVSADALGSALGPDLLGQVARQFGGNSQQAAGTLAQILPGLIDQLTPKGQVPADNALNDLGALLGGSSGGQGPDLGALAGALGGLLRR